MTNHYFKSTAGWRRYLTMTYWRMRLMFLIGRSPQLNIVATIDADLPDDMTEEEIAAVRRGIQEAAEGRTVSIDEVRRRL